MGGRTRLHWLRSAMDLRWSWANIAEHILTCCMGVLDNAFLIITYKGLIMCQRHLQWRSRSRFKQRSL
jgi:hypothetical protein